MSPLTKQQEDSRHRKGKQILTQCPLYIGLRVTEWKTGGAAKKGITEHGSTPGMCLQEECELYEEECLIRRALKKTTLATDIFALAVRMYIDSMEKR